jgi:nitrate reductase NapAB chaperone NapD
MEEIRMQESWNKKKIFIAVFLLLLLIAGGYLFKTRVLNENLSQLAKSVKGTSTEQENTKPTLKVSVQKAIEEKINDLKQEVSGLDILEIASSSPQMQKIINDIKSLEQYPTNQVKEICKKICGL